MSIFSSAEGFKSWSSQYSYHKPNVISDNETKLWRSSPASLLCFFLKSNPESHFSLYWCFKTSLNLCTYLLKVQCKFTIFAKTLQMFHLSSLICGSIIFHYVPTIVFSPQFHRKLLTQDLLGWKHNSTQESSSFLECNDEKFVTYVIEELTRGDVPCTYKQGQTIMKDVKV